MQDLSFAQLVHVAVDGVDATHRISVAQQGRPLPFPLGHEEWNRETCAEAMLRRARGLGRVGVPSTAELIRFIDAAAAAERTAAVMALMPADADPDGVGASWGPRHAAGYIDRADRQLFVDHWGWDDEIAHLVLDGHPQTAAVAEALGIPLFLPLARQILAGHAGSISSTGTEHVSSAGGAL